jgi:hypothetical protein
MNAPVPQRNVIFVSYAHDDAEYVDQLKLFLEDMVGDHLPGYEVWIDRTDMGAGDDWDAKIRDALEVTRVAVLMWSYKFKQSRYIKGTEFPMFWEAEAQGLLHLVPVLVNGQDALNEHLLHQRNVLNHERPLAGRPKHECEAIYHQVATRVRELIKGQAEAARPSPAAPAAPVATPAVAPPRAPVASVAPIPATSATAAQPAVVVPNLLPSIQALLDPASEPLRVGVLADDAQGRQALLLWLEPVDDQLMLAVADADQLAELPWSDGARQVLRDELAGVSRPLGRVDGLRPADVVAQVQRVLVRLGLPSASIGVHAEAEAVTDGAEPVVEGLAECVEALLDGRQRVAVQVMARFGGEGGEGGEGDDEGGDLPLLWLDRRAQDQLTLSLPDDRDLPPELAVPRAVRQAIRALPGHSRAQGLDTVVLGRIQALETEAVCGVVEQWLQDAYGWPESQLPVVAELVEPA